MRRYMNKEVLSELDALKHEKDKLNYYRQTIFENERKMTKLTMDRNVGLYVLNCERYLDLIKNGKTYGEEMIKITETMRSLEHLDGVKEYKELKDINESIKMKICNYYKNINCSLRRKIYASTRMPDIYVKSEYNYTHVINDYDDLIDDELPNATLIEPVYEMTSKRDLRHFYNKTSFHFMEALIDDWDLDIGNKELGKVLIK